MKAVKKSSMSMNMKLVAVFVAGLAVATFGWWQADRLDLAMGASAGINEIREGGIGRPAPMPDKCNPSDPAKKPQRRYDNCRVYTTLVGCKPQKQYVSYPRTKSGTAMTVSAVPGKGAVEQITYTASTEETTAEVQAELDKTTKEIAQAQKTKSAAVLAKDSEYQDKLVYKKELDNAIRVNPRCKIPVAR